MSIISLISPMNLEEEKRKFILDQTYNPQFVYEHSFDDSLLRKWGEPQEKIVSLARKIMAKRANLLTNRVVIDPRILVNMAKKVFEDVGITESIEITFDPQKVTRCSVKGTQIIFRDPTEFESTQEIQATFNHELQTHLLRNLNQMKQGWKLNREKFDGQILRTEEGLAVLHSTIALEEKLLWRPSAYYVAVWLGIQMGFSAMFAELLKMGFNEDFAWRLTIRVKRGLTDTSLPGGNSKDICYLEGALQMWRWLGDENHNPRHLYIGKVFIEELDEKLKLMATRDIYLPIFYKDIPSYRKQIQRIGAENFFEEEL